MKTFSWVILLSLFLSGMGRIQRSAFAASQQVVLLPQSDARLLAVEKELAQLINEERAKRHLPLLTYSSRLAAVARAHSAEMRDQKYFSHKSPTPPLQWPMNRYQQGFDRNPHLVAENIYRCWGGSRGIEADAAQAAHQSLMNSPGHKANILFTSVTRIGIGVMADSKGNLWVTEMFVRR